MTAGFYTYALSAFCYFLLAALSHSVQTRNTTGKVIVFATLLSFFSAVITAVVNNTIDSEYSRLIIRFGYIVSESFHSVGWCIFIAILLKPQDSERDENIKLLFSPTLIVILFSTVSSLIALATYLNHKDALTNRYLLQLNSVSWICLAILGLVMLEQLYKKTDKSNLWMTKHLVLGLAIVFAYDILLYTNSLLRGHIDSGYWNARGIVNAFAVPLIAISISRNTKWSLNIHVSRDVVFHSVSIIGAGIYILLAAFIAYSMKNFDISWIEILQITFFTLIFIISGLYFLSENNQVRTKNFLSKHLYSHQYDYRKEWLCFTNTLANHDADIYGRVLAAILGILKSPGGSLWIKNAGDSYQCVTSTNAIESEAIVSECGKELKNYFEKYPEPIELRASNPTTHAGSDIGALRYSNYNFENRWLITPLQLNDQNIGFIEVNHPTTHRRLDWEDRDFLDAASLQAAAFLALHHNSQLLTEAKQFEAFNKLSTYVVHDLKNILGQLTLIVNNSKVHGNNPEFINDVFQTLEHSNSRITGLVQQLRTGVISDEISPVKLTSFIKNLSFQCASRKPIPIFESLDTDQIVSANTTRLGRSISHLIQNAQEAAGAAGSVIIKLRYNDKFALIQIVDNGHGMTDEFIKTKLYQPFFSTKGLTGMGIGAYESREYIISIGGMVKVNSEVGQGTLFTILLPTTLVI